MEVLDIKREEYGSGIPIKGLNTVKSVLEIFYSGRTKNSGATLGRLTRDGGGIEAIFMRMMADTRDVKDRFLEAMFSEMESGLKARGIYSRSYDYDGVGPFFKTTVTVTEIDKKVELYLLQMHAAYVGNEVEKRLAEALNIERGLQWLRVGIEVKPVKGKFEIDFNDVMERVIKINGIARISGEKAAKTFFVEDHFGNYCNLTLMNAGKFIVDLCLEDVAQKVDYSGRQKKLTWSAKGSVLSGPLREDWNDKNKILNPVILFSIHSANERLPILKTEIKEEVKVLADTIKAAFGGERDKPALNPGMNK